MRSYMSLIVSGLLLFGLGANFSGSDSHSSELSLSNLKDRAASAQIEAGAETAPHRGSGR